ncbi:hypothetical protein COLO4_34282 [Corchorus olitorius]|uniref:Protein kinase domain-containing protein n=1 Tax=Corchorus olitorius TaxID=93759 RepID=A0A1R3GMG6_9ROSI|nr:hypothetical protein COLO4_34282 [Corchorus olitorius]
MAKKERLLVYQYMANGTLNDNLHSLDDAKKAMEWPLRLKIGIRAAKGFAWLHHNCNPPKAPENFKGNLVEWITQLSNDGKLQDAIDTSLVGKGFDNELFQFIKVACSCVLPPAKERPTMFEVYQLLRAIGERYNFTAEDEILMPSDTGDAHLEELIVAREVNGNN